MSTKTTPEKRILQSLQQHDNGKYMFPLYFLYAEEMDSGKQVITLSSNEKYNTSHFETSPFYKQISPLTY